MTKFIILCGGIGRRNNQYSLPKPLNYINGRHMIEYIVENIPSPDIYIIYNIALAEYNFEEIIKNSIKSKHFHFAQVEYLTRGAVETARIGIINLLDNSRQAINVNNNITLDDNIIFLDNDNIHSLQDITYLDGNCIGYSKNYDKNQVNYSFITILDNKVINIEEKNKISDNYCCGIYGFKTAKLFLDYSSKLILENNKTKNEFYFSQMYNMMLQNKLDITPVYITNTRHIGTLDEIKNNLNSGKCIGLTKKLRICFDLDNTLVTYPSIPGDYSTVKPIKENINLLKNLKNAGHEIIIYTARRMATHHHNIGRVMRDIAKITLDTLDTLGIEYDEIIFGKPIADIYIDDRALNPYVNNISYFGLMFDKGDYCPNKLSNNKYNTITRKGNQIIKSGPFIYMRGELYFYQNISCDKQLIDCSSSNCSNVNLKTLFPSLIDFNKIGDKLEITLEYINGIPLYYLYKNQLFTEKHLDKLFDILDVLHTNKNQISIEMDSIYNNYFKKLESRFNPHDYFFNDAKDIYNKIITRLKTTYKPNVVGIIHGDFWFSNILLDYDDNFKCLDMKGQVDGELTLNGDIYYDYGKLYQSILGYDLVINNCYPNNNSASYNYIEKIKKYFINKCIAKGLNIQYLEAVTHSLIFGVFHSINSNEDKIRIWQFLVSLIAISD